MRRRGKNTRTLENISSETFKGSSSKLLPDSTRRPRRYIWSQLFLSGHSDLLIINSRLRVSVGFSPTSPKRKQKLQPNFGCKKESISLLGSGAHAGLNGFWWLGNGLSSLRRHRRCPRACKLGFPQEAGGDSWLPTYIGG